MKKLTLSQLRVKSFIIQQEETLQYTIKAGAVTIGSDGPPHTSSSHSENPECSAFCPSIHYCVDSDTCNNYTSVCGTGGSGTSTQITQ